MLNLTPIMKCNRTRRTSFLKKDNLKLQPSLTGHVNGAKKYKILIVDDEPDIASIMKLGLEKAGFLVDAFTEPLKALEYYQKEGQFDLALLDIRMTPINGFELYRRLQNVDKKLRVCFITAFEIYFDEFKRVFPKIQVDCFVKKPVSIQQLVNIIAAQLDPDSIKVPQRD